MNYFIFIMSLFFIMNPFWSDYIKLLRSGKRIFLMRPVSVLDFYFHCWQSVFFVSLIGLLWGLVISLCTELSKFMALVVGTIFVWVMFFVNLIVLYWWLKINGCRSELQRLFNVMAASWLITGILLPGLVITPGNFGLFFPMAVPLLIYYVVIVGKSVSSIFPNLKINRAIFGALISMICVAIAGMGLVWLLR